MGPRRCVNGFVQNSSETGSKRVPLYRPRYEVAYSKKQGRALPSGQPFWPLVSCYGCQGLLHLGSNFQRAHSVDKWVGQLKLPTQLTLVERIRG